MVNRVKCGTNKQAVESAVSPANLRVLQAGDKIPHHKNGQDHGLGAQNQGGHKHTGLCDQAIDGMDPHLSGKTKILLSVVKRVKCPQDTAGMLPPMDPVGNEVEGNETDNIFNGAWQALEDVESKERQLRVQQAENPDLKQQIVNSEAIVEPVSEIMRKLRVR